MHPWNDQANFSTDRVLLSRMTGLQSSRVRVLRDADMLRQLNGGGSDRANYAQFAATLERSATAGFAIEAVGSGDLLGVTGFSTIESVEKRATLAPIWAIVRLDEPVLVSHVMHLMTRYAFEVLAVERLDVHLNWRLRNMLHLYEGLGFRCEGRLRAYFAGDQGPSADAAVLSVIRSEWPSLADRQREILAGEAWRYRLPSDRLP